MDVNIPETSKNSADPPEHYENAENLDLLVIPLHVQLKILKKFHNYQDLANIEEACKLLASLVNEAGYIFQADRVAIDEETEFIVANSNEYENVGSFTERNTKIICEELEFSYTDLLLIMDESRQIEAIQAIENNGTRAKRLIFNISLDSQELFDRLLAATQPKQLKIWCEINSDFLKNDYIYEKIEQLVVSENTKILEEDILKFTAPELSIMDGTFTLSGLLQITVDYITSRREISLLRICFRENSISSENVAQALQEEFPIHAEENRIIITRLGDGHQLQIVFGPDSITFSELDTYW